MNPYNINIHIVEDDRFFSSMLKEMLRKSHFTNTRSFSSGEEFLNNIHTGPEVVILDYSLGDTNGLDILKKIRSVDPNIQVIILSAQEKMSVAIDSLKFGAFDYLEKSDAGLKRLTHLLKRVIQMNALTTDKRTLGRLKRNFAISLGIVLAAVIYINFKHFPLF